MEGISCAEIRSRNEENTNHTHTRKHAFCSLYVRTTYFIWNRLRSKRDKIFGILEMNSAINDM